MPSITINYAAADGPRFQAAVGKDYNLLNSSGQPRVATAAECKQWFIDRAKDAINRNERPALEKTALASVSVPPVDMT